MADNTSGITVQKVDTRLAKRGLRIIKRTVLRTLRRQANGHDATEPLFAEKPVDPLTLSCFRAENFPPAGPYPWLDRPEALVHIEEKLKAGLITQEEARLCEYWHQRGYVILNRLVEPKLLDEGWCAYEEAVSKGIIELTPENVSGDDHLPGRY